MPKYKGEEVDTTPTKAMQANAIKGLEWREEFGRGGTLVGVRRANQLKKREYLSPQTVRRMKAYFDRHQVDLEAPKNKDPNANGYPGAGLIAWYLWGGDEGWSWSQRKVEELNRIDEESDRSDRARWRDLRVGDFVNWRTEKGIYLGKIASIRTEGFSEVGDEEVEASPEDPVARIRVFTRTDDGFQATDRYVAFPFSRLTKTDPPEERKRQLRILESS